MGGGGGLPYHNTMRQVDPPPPQEGRPPPQKADPVIYTVNQRAVRILLECILVGSCDSLKFSQINSLAAQYIETLQMNGGGGGGFVENGETSVK